MQQLVHAISGALNLDVLRLERVSANLANALTPGYKREVVVPAQRPDAPPALQVLRDLRPGTLRHTGLPLDVALAGPGYFEVATPQGLAYTRQGLWHVDARGRLVTAAGHALMGSHGEVVLVGSEPRIDADGSIFEGGNRITRLNIVDFDDAASLTPLDGGVFAPGSKARRLHDDEVQLLQGHVENSNVTAVREMVELTRLMRHFESSLRALQARDELAGAALRRLGDF